MTVVGDGRAAIAAFDAAPVDLVVLDLMLPGIGGEAVLAAIRDAATRRSSSRRRKRSDTERIAGLRMGADDYLAKPFNPHELTARVAAILRRSRRGAVGDVAGPAGSRRRTSRRCPSTAAGSSSTRPAARFTLEGGDGARSDGRLTPGEIGLLAALARRPGRGPHPRPAARGRSPGGPTRSTTGSSTSTSRTCGASSATTPRSPWLIETIPQTGYRLVAARGRAVTDPAVAADCRRRRRHRGAWRRRSLAWRLGLLLGVAVVGVLLLVGVVVNRVVSSGFQTVLTDQQQQRLDDAAVTLADRLARPAGLARAQARRDPARHIARRRGPGGQPGRHDAGRLRQGPPTATRPLRVVPIEVDGQDRRHARGRPAGPGRRPRLPAAVQCHAAPRRTRQRARRSSSISASIAGRLTRPLHDVAAAARRLEAGDPGARATGGDDLESTELAEAFNAMADRLERSEMLRRRAASDIAHDLATPATVLESQLQAMIDGVVPDRPGRPRGGPLGRRGARRRRGRHRRPRARRGGAAPGRARSGRPGGRDPEIALALDGPRRGRDRSRLEVDVAPGDARVGGPGPPRARRSATSSRNALGHSPAGGVVGVVAGRAARIGRRDPRHRPGPGHRAGRRRRTSSSASTGPTRRAPPTRRPAGATGLGLGPHDRPRARSRRTAAGSGSSGPGRTGTTFLHRGAAAG